MKKNIFLSVLLISSFMFSQTNEELKKEIETIKNQISSLRTDIESVKMKNLYLKEVLEINKPILEQEHNGNKYKITKVVGNRKDKTISINFLIEAKDENKQAIFMDYSIIDLLGNEFSKFDYKQTTGINPKLSVDVPMNIKFTFKDIIDEPKVIKMFRFRTQNKPQANTFNSNSSRQEFRDLNVVWE